MSEMLPEYVFESLQAIEAKRRTLIDEVYALMGNACFSLTTREAVLEANLQADIELATYKANLSIGHPELRDPSKIEMFGSIDSLWRHRKAVNRYLNFKHQGIEPRKAIEAKPEENVEHFIGGLMIASEANLIPIEGYHDGIFVYVEPNSEKLELIEIYNHQQAARRSF